MSPLGALMGALSMAQIGLTWYSDDHGLGWHSQAAAEMWAWAVTPIGLVGSSADRSGNLLVWAATDGLTWTDLEADLASDQLYPETCRGDRASG
jgi:hypothetical protein